MLKKYWIPHEGNDYKPHFLREKNLLTIFFIAIIILSASAALKYSFLTNKNLAAVLSSVLINLTNEDRQENNIQSLAVNTVLTMAAQKKADDMAAKGYFSHTSPDGLTPWYWFSQVGYKFSYAGENLAVNFFDSSEVETAWMNSVKHRENILNGNFTEIGIATAKGLFQGRETIFVVQLFGKPTKNTVPTPIKDIPAQVQEEKVETIKNENNFIAVKNTATDTLQPEIIPGTPGTALGVVSPQTDISWFNKLIASPRNTLKYIYSFIGFMILGSLLLMIIIEVRKQSHRHIVYALSLVLVMVALISVSQNVIFPQTIIW